MFCARRIWTRGDEMLLPVPTYRMYEVYAFGTEAAS